MITSSSTLTSECSAGSSRNQRNQAAAQTKPIAPNTTKTIRQGKNCRSTDIRRGVTPPPRWAPAKKMPWAVPRSVTGIQREKHWATLGKAPASPAPNRNRTPSKDAKLNAAAVAIVKLDHQITIRVNNRRGPMRSPQSGGDHRKGIAIVNALNTNPICGMLRFSSRMRS